MDLVRITDELCMSEDFPIGNSYEDILKTRPPHLFEDALAADVMPKNIRDGLAARKMMGTMCALPSCQTVEMSREKPTLKRCARVRSLRSNGGATLH